MPQQVEFIRAWQSYVVGNVIEPAAILRNWLLLRGYVKAYTKPFEPDSTHETAIVEQETAVLSHAPRKRGRPRLHKEIT